MKVKLLRIVRWMTRRYSSIKVDGDYSTAKCIYIKLKVFVSPIKRESKWDSIRSSSVDRYIFKYYLTQQSAIYNWIKRTFKLSSKYDNLNASSVAKQLLNLKS